MKIDDKTIEKILQVYDPGFRFLVSADIKYPETQGEFHVHAPPYSPLNLQYFTAIEAQFCLNQMGYAALYEGLQQGRFPEVAGNDFRRFIPQETHFAYIKTLGIDFRRVIRIDAPISGSLILEQKELGRYFLKLHTEFEFEGGKAGGKCIFAIGPVKTRD
ncbi:TPA: hypothetical protein HA265_02395 [Candidatus Woesearchaeota archaeon]|nr:hypothetical protein [Candidatus Woesearchaeota archaeon]